VRCCVAADIANRGNESTAIACRYVALREEQTLEGKKEFVLYTITTDVERNFVGKPGLGLVERTLYIKVTPHSGVAKTRLTTTNVL
jgi:hypothetical protein